MDFTRVSLLTIALLVGSTATAQTTRTARDTVEAYGARLNAPGDPAAAPNTHRYNNRINNRINSRLQTRIERFRIDASADPVSAYQRPDNGSATQAYQQADAAGRQGRAGTTPTRERRNPYPTDDQYPDTSFTTSAPTPR
jgi:hypothetical protein